MIETSFRIGSKELTAAEWDAVNERWRSGELEFHRTSSEADDGVFGLEVAGTESHRNGCDVVEVPISLIEAVLATARAKLAAYGLEVEARLFLVPHVSC